MIRPAAVLAASLLCSAMGLASCSREAPLSGTPSGARTPPGVGTSPGVGKDLIAPAAKQLSLGLSLRAVEGYRRFTHYCAICHGAFGAGDGFNSFNLDPKPRDLSDVIQKEGKELVRKTIREGTAALGRTPLCPPWELTMSDDAIDEIVLFIGNLDTVRKSSQPAPATSQTPPTTSQPTPTTSPPTPATSPGEKQGTVTK